MENSNLKPFKFWCQTVMPVVYDESLSYYELLCKVVSYINNLITDVDTATTAITTLQSYVENYFSTTTIQDAINDSLDVMASDGTLLNLVRTHLPIVIVDTVADVANIGDAENGTVIKTKGYYETNDGGASTFYIGGAADNNVPLSIRINAEKYANIEKKSSYKAIELGFKNDDGITNNTEIFNSLNPCESEIVFDSGTYAFDELLITKNNHLFSFVGVSDKSPFINNARYGNDSLAYRGKATFFAPYKDGSQNNNRQRFVLKVGGDSGYTAYSSESAMNANYFTGFNIRDITFTDKGYIVSQYLVSIEYCAMISGNLSFRQCVNKCLSFRNTWEHYWDYIVFRNVILDPSLAMWEMLNKTTPSGNISAISVGLIDVEGFQSTILKVSSGAQFNASTLDNVQVEGSILTSSNGHSPYATTNKNVFVPLTVTVNGVQTNRTITQEIINASYGDYDSAVKVPLFMINNGLGITIKNINLQKVGYEYFTVNASGSPVYVHSLFSGVASLYVGVITVDTTFHWFTISESNETNSARYITINEIKCDKAALQPPVANGLTYDYRVIISANTIVNNSTLFKYVKTTANNINSYNCSDTAFSIDKLKTAIGANTYRAYTNTQNSITISGVQTNNYLPPSITVIPLHNGVVTTVQACYSRSNASLKVSRYKDNVLVDSITFDVGESNGFIVRTKSFESDAVYNQWMIEVVPNNAESNYSIALGDLIIT